VHSTDIKADVAIGSSNAVSLAGALAGKQSWTAKSSRVIRGRVYKAKHCKPYKKTGNWRTGTTQFLNCRLCYYHSNFRYNCVSGMHAVMKVQCAYSGRGRGRKYHCSTKYKYSHKADAPKKRRSYRRHQRGHKKPKKKYPRRQCKRIGYGRHSRWHCSYKNKVIKKSKYANRKRSYPKCTGKSVHTIPEGRWTNKSSRVIGGRRYKTMHCKTYKNTGNWKIGTTIFLKCRLCRYHKGFAYKCPGGMSTVKRVQCGYTGCGRNRKYHCSTLYSY